MAVEADTLEANATRRNHSMKTEVMQRLLRGNQELTPLVRIEIAKRLDQYAHELLVLKDKALPVTPKASK